MSKTLSTTIKGVSIEGAILIQAMEKLPVPTFTKSDFAQAMKDAGSTHSVDNDLVRRVMQFLKRHGLIDFDSSINSWQMTPLGHMRLPNKTLPLLASSHASSLPQLSTDRLERVAEHARLGISALACLGLVMALVGLNASFAWELGREAAQFQILIAIGVMALDVMRPSFVMIGLYLTRHGQIVWGSFALAVALVLSPVSVISTTTILSSSFLLGAEINSDAAMRAATREALRVQHRDLLERAAQNEAAWRTECARGGCGPIAEDLEAEFQNTVAEAQEALNKIISLTEADESNSDLLARMVTTFEELGLFGAGRKMVLPLLLAISLELGALFGPALLLTRRRSKPAQP